MKCKVNFENNILMWILKPLFWSAILYCVLGGYDLIYILIIGVVIPCLIALIQLLTSAILGHYSSRGFLYGWYDRTLKVMGVSWILDPWENICRLGLINKNFINFISPSGNKGTYEKFLFDNIVTSENKINFIVSDKENLEKHEKSISYYDSNFTYVPHKDAFDIQNTINECNLENVNVIWDFKGMLWYSAFSGKDRYSKTLKAFENYHNVLADNGIIIIDSIYINPIFTFINSILNMLFNFRIGLAEISTVQRLDKLLCNKKAKNLKDYLKLNFDKPDIVYSNKTFIRVYKKK